MRPHIPVLLNEVLNFFDPAQGKRFIDATLGRGGHTAELLAKGAEVLGIDADPAVVAASEIRAPRFKIANGNFGDIKKIAEDHNFTGIDGVLFDLGLGSHQLDDPERGFSFQKDGPLDMRFSKTELTAHRIVNFYPEKDLIRIFQKYGEEMRFARRIARAIMIERKSGSIDRTARLFELIKKTLPAKFRFRAGDSARRIFQGLRIEVNDELGNLERGLQQALLLLKQGGRLVVISFHSLEDRIVKTFFVKEAKDCVCPPSFPVCRCDARASLKILTKKPVLPAEEEIKINTRSHSAKLRAAEKI